MKTLYLKQDIALKDKDRSLKLNTKRVECSVKLVSANIFII